MKNQKPPIIDSDDYYGIRILKNGTWLYNGTPIHRHNLVKLFASVLKKDETGGYWLITPYEKGRIEVEDVPFTAVELKAEEGNLYFRTNMDEWVTAGENHPLRVDFDPVSLEPSPYILVRDNLEARIIRPVYYELARMVVEHEHKKGVYGVWSQHHFYPIGKIDI